MSFPWVESGIRPRTVRFEREIRDPIYRYVKLTNVENAIVDSRYFQRLSHISQMHSAYLVYPGAQYTRKIHSFGVMHIIHRMITHILYQQFDSEIAHPLLHISSPFSDRREKWGLEHLSRLHEGLKKQGAASIQPEDVPVYVVQIARLAGLLHDLGHGPHSHLVEAASDDGTGPRFNHEKKSVDLILEGLTENLDGLDGPYLSKEDGKVLAGVLAGGSSLVGELIFLHEMVSSALDADKMDYLVRDAHYAGTPEYGTIDLDRIIDALVVRNGRLKFVSGSIDALVEALNSMFFMYNNVYLHRAVRGFDLAVLEDLRRIAKELRAFQTMEPGEYVEFDDAHFVTWIDQNYRRLEGELATNPERLAEFQKWCAAKDGMARVWRRDKKYRAIVDTRVSVPLALIRREHERDDLGEQIERLRERLRPHVERLSLRTSVSLDLDMEKTIRPIGLGIVDVVSFFTGTAFYDPDRKKETSFFEYEPHYKTMTKIVIPIRVFARYGEHRRLHDSEVLDLRDAFANELAAYEAVIDRRLRA